MHIERIDSLEGIPAADWNALVEDNNPFLRHELLVAMERHACIGEHFGWLPQYLLAYDDDRRLLGAVPMYLKDNSYGEFVFDWSWADAYARAGLSYYPKLVVAVPYTPATGQRILHRQDDAAPAIRAALIRAAIQSAEELGVSSLHWLFTPDDLTCELEAAGLSRRVGVQFHWHNNGYEDFDAYLATFSSAKRKKVKRERRMVSDAGIDIEVLHGGDMDQTRWDILHRFYRSTFARKSGTPTLTQPFFEEISRTLPEHLVLVMAKKDDEYVAGAIMLRSDTALYGRHWGCRAEYPGLHFEACYYQGLDYCMRHGLQRFEPGAQGEHKISRGFLPQETYSAHWIADPHFAHAVADFTRREARAMRGYKEELDTHSPFKAEGCGRQSES